MPLNLNKKFGNVELHNHLDGSYRMSTILDLAKSRGITLPKDTVKELEEYFVVKQPTTLRGFLKKFPEFLQCVAGSKEGIYRTSYEFIEDAADNKICYIEARFCPNFLEGEGLTSEEILQTVLSAFSDAGKVFGVEARVIIAGIREFAQWSDSLLQLALKYRDSGVVAIDIAGDEELSIESGGTHDHLVKIFKAAEKAGLHRTVHAGENGPAESVREAVEDLHAERIGHGYHVLEDKKLYEELKRRDIHFEICPTSSRLTSAVPYDWAEHPLHQFIKDNVNFSINTDDTILIGHRLLKEQEIVCREFGLNKQQLQRVNLNAARSSFLPDDEKQQLTQHLERLYASSAGEQQ